MIGIVDYEMGNIFSLNAALKRLGCQYKMVVNKEDAAACSSLILPGVGAFGDAIANLRAKGLDELLITWATSGKPLLGICLGMQLLFTASEEHGTYSGLNILSGTIKKIPPGLKIPHMGWNELKAKKDYPVFQEFTEGYVYFVHSYYAVTEEQYILATTDYVAELPAIVGQGNVLGMQFHPEKSGKAGLRLLENWVKTYETKV